MGPSRTVVQVVVPVADVELAADALWQAGPSAVGEADLGDGRVRLTADVTDPERIDARWGHVVVPEEDDAYLDAWRSWAAPVRAGRHLVLHPAWIAPEPHDPADVVLVLDPGRAFGSGSHESTRLALAALEDHVRSGDRVLDVGCGSGVLAVAGCLLGAASVVGVDVAEEAVTATLANAAANGVADRITADTRPLHEVDGTYEVVVANISAAVVTELAAELEARVVPGGVLVLAGMLDEQVDGVLAAHRPCVEVARSSEAGWSALVLRLGGPQPPTRRRTGPEARRT